MRFLGKIKTFLKIAKHIIFKRSFSTDPFLCRNEQKNQYLIISAMGNNNNACKKLLVKFLVKSGQELNILNKK